jgi:hypothetical protein
MASAVTELLQYIASIIGPAAGDPRTAASVRTPLGQLASRTRWLKETLADVLVGSAKQVSGVDLALDQINVAAHGWSANDPIRLFAVNGGTLPAPLTADTVFYLRAVDADHFELSAASGPGAKIDLTGALSGDVYAAKVPAWVSSMLVADATYGYGKLRDLVVWVAGGQAISGAKTFDDISVSGANRYKVAARSVTRSLNPLWVRPSSGDCARMTFSAPASSVWAAPLDVPHAQTLTSVRIYINPTDTGALPGDLPSIAIMKHHKATGAETVVGGSSVTDSPADATAYSAAHSFGPSGLSEVIDTESYTYRVDFTQEDVNSGSVIGLDAVCTVSTNSTWM